MKIRQGFVSNSSSSSFVIQIKYLEEWQLRAITNHIEYANLMCVTTQDRYRYNLPNSSVDIENDSEYICIHSYEGNEFNISTFLNDIGLNYGYDYDRYYEGE